METSRACFTGWKYYLIGLMSLVLLFIPDSGWSGDLTVEPGGLLIQKVPIGEVYDLSKESGITLKIYNKLDRPITYKISAKRPSETGSGRWMAGYQEIPDPGWLSFGSGEVTIEAQRVGEVKMYLKIPPERGYYNQHWAVTVVVEGQLKPGEVFALAAYLPFEIETEQKERAGKRPWGKIRVEPSLLTVRSAEKEKKKVKIYNNDGEDHKYRIQVGIPPDRSLTRRISPSPGHSELPDPSWIGISHTEVVIKQGKMKEVSVWPRLPRVLPSPGPWETLLWVESESGETAFIRVDVE
ncbi:MAG: hypothetical protein QME90_00770 [Thermodesulfobacteriota bacterium]|nr:hypothetical protein [Thermodesulfobacteriota bacterium]